MKINRLEFTIFVIILFLLIPSFSVGSKSNDVGEVYFLVLNKLAMEDIENMPNLLELSEKYSLALMNTRGTNSYTGAESFATINSASKTFANDISSDFMINENGEIKNIATGRIYNLNDQNRYNPDIGILGDKLKDNKKTTAIFGNSNYEDKNITYSALIPMTSEGTIDMGIIEDTNLDKDGYPFNITTNYELLLEENSSCQADVRVFDLGDLERLSRASSDYTNEDFFKLRNNILKDMDDFIGILINKVLDEKDMLIITSPNAPDPLVTTSKLSPLLISSDISKDSSMESGTTKRSNIVANIDLAPTILDYFNIEIDNLAGSKINFNTKNKVSFNTLLKESKLINTVSDVRYKSLLYYGVFSIITLIFISIIDIGNFRLSHNFKKFKKVLLSLIIFIPSIFIFLSLIKPSNIFYYIGIIGILIIISIVLQIKFNVISDNVFILSIFNLFIIILDLILKGSISKYSVLSHDPIIGARYYGIGNEMIGLLLGNLAIFTRNLNKYFNTKKQNIITIILLILLLGLVGHPNIGANLGGTLALFMVLIFYIIEHKEINLNFKKIISLGFMIVFLFFFIGFLDLKFSKNITHLGNTVLLIVNGGIINFIQIIFRKLLMNIKLIGTSFWTFVLFFSILSLIIKFKYNKYKYNDALKSSIAIILGTLMGFLVNDSGLILAAVSLNFIAADYFMIDNGCFIKRLNN